MIAIGDYGIRLVNVAIAGFYSVHVMRSTRVWNRKNTFLCLMGSLLFAHICVLGFQP